MLINASKFKISLWPRKNHTDIIKIVYNYISRMAICPNWPLETAPCTLGRSAWTSPRSAFKNLVHFEIPPHFFSILGFVVLYFFDFLKAEEVGMVTSEFRHFCENRKSTYRSKVSMRIQRSRPFFMSTWISQSDFEVLAQILESFVRYSVLMKLDVLSCSDELRR